MDLAPVSRSAVSDGVFGQLVDQILSGRIAPEEPLPSERELAEAFAVNRHAVREALKRVQQAGLVRISQGGKTRVLDWRTHAGLDVLSALVSSGALPQVRILHDIAVMRRSVAADAARLCAEVASAEQLDRIRASAEAYPSTYADVLAVAAADLDFWSAVIAGSGNVAYQLALNTLVAGYSEIGWGTIASLGLSEEYADRRVHLELAELLCARDGDAARRVAEELLGRLVTALASPSASLPQE